MNALTPRFFLHSLRTLACLVFLAALSANTSVARQLHQIYDHEKKAIEEEDFLFRATRFMMEMSKTNPQLKQGLDSLKQIYKADDLIKVPTYLIHQMFYQLGGDVDNLPCYPGESEGAVAKRVFKCGQSSGAVTQSTGASSGLPQSDALIRYEDNPSVQNLTVNATYSGACAEHVALTVRVFSRAQELPFSKVLPFIKDAAGQIEQRCPTASDIYVEVGTQFASTGPNPGRQEAQYYLLKKSSNWNPEPTEGIVQPFLDEKVVSLGASNLNPLTSKNVTWGRETNGLLLMKPDHSFIGVFQFGTQPMTTAKFSGKFAQTPPVDMSREYFPKYAAEGMWFSFGNRTNQCDTRKNGYAYWGTYKIMVEPSSVTIRFCEEGRLDNVVLDYKLVLWNSASRGNYSSVYADEKSFFNQFNPPANKLIAPNADLERKRKSQEAAEQEKARSRLGK